MPKLTVKVVTLWYRAPELLLGNPNYGPGVDMWSLGCIIVELIQKRPLFPASTEADLINMIYSLLGTPSPEAFEKLKPPGSSLVCPPYQPSQFSVSHQPALIRACHARQTRVYTNVYLTY
jgi:serine/threonine protein kinase